MSSKLETEKPKKRKSNFSRRGFLQGVGITSGALTTGILETEAEAQTGAKIAGPGEVPITLQINGKPHPVSQAFVNNDAQQCGYCTPGFVMAAKGFLDKHPNPSYEDVKKGLGGNLCRCGTYVGVRKAVLEAAKEMNGAKNG